jgi:anti-sigma B factor antagonist
MKASHDLELRSADFYQPNRAWPPLRIDSLAHGDDLRLVVSGELDIATDAALRDALAAATSRHIDLDLRGVSFIGCTTLRVLLHAAATRAELGGGVSICDASDAVRRLLEMAGVDCLFAR